MKWSYVAPVALAAVLGATVLLGPGSGSRGPASGSETRGDLGKISIDPEWAKRLAARSRDPAGLAGSGVSSRIHGVAADSSTRDGAHHSLLYRTGYVGVEPTLGVTSNGWIFYVAIDTTGTSGLDSVVIRSKDSGATWEQVSVPRVTEDPYLWVDPATDRVFWVDFAGCGLMSYSDDFGESWTDLPPVGCGHNTDHQTLYAGPPTTSTTRGYPNVIYYCAAGGGSLNVSSTMTTCSKSIDGGQTFLPTLTPPYPPAADAEAVAGLPGQCGGLSGHIFVGADGALYVPRGVCGQPWLAVSRDEGNTWTRVQVADIGMARDAYGLWDHEAAVRADGRGQVFYSWVAHDRIPYLAVSRDGGNTWGAPIRVAPPDVKEAVLPNMDMDAAGRLVFTYMGSTNSPGAPFATEMYCQTQLCPGYYVVAAPYLKVTWNAYITLASDPLKANPIFETVTVNDPADPLIRGECGPFRCQAEYDFIDVEFGPAGQIVSAVIDGCEPDQPCTNPGEAVLGTMVKGQAPPPSGSPARFIAAGSLSYAFVADASRASGATSPEGCAMETGAAVGTLGAPPPAGPCHSSQTGTLTAYSLDPAEFTSAPLPAPLLLGGATRLVFHVTGVDNKPDVFSAYPYYFVHQVPSEGEAVLLDEGFAATAARDGRNEVLFDLPALAVPAGSRLRFSFKVEGDRTAGARMHFGGEPYADAGIDFTVGRLSAKDADASDAPPAAAAGALPVALLAPLLVVGARRRRRLRSAHSDLPDRTRKAGDTGRGQMRPVLIATLLSALGVSTAQAGMFLAFTPDPNRAGALSPEGCHTEPGLARGLLTSTSAASPCHNGQFGSISDPSLIVGQAPTETVALFTTGVLSNALSVGGRATLVVYHNVPSGPGANPAGQDLSAKLEYKLREQHPAGHSTTIASGTAFDLPPDGGRGEVSFDVPAYTVSPGGRFQVLLFCPNAAEGRVFFGGKPLIDDASGGNAMYYASYADAGITLGGAAGGGVGPGSDGSDPDPLEGDDGDGIPTLEPPADEPPQEQQPAPAGSDSGGALGASLLAPLVIAGLARRRRRR